MRQFCAGLLGVWVSLFLTFVARADSAPLAITVQQDFGHLSSALIDDKGGTIQAQAADGTQFTLTVPANAVATAVRIYLIPIGPQAQGYPFAAGITAGVQIEPEGLLLDKLARLTIQLTKAPDPKSLATFGYHEDGVEFHLYPAQLSGNTLTYALDHFSGYGTGQASPAETGAVPPPATPQDQARQQIAQALNQCRATSCDMSTDPTFHDQVNSALTSWGNAIENALKAFDRLGQTEDLDEEIVTDEIHQFLAWAQTVEIASSGVSYTNDREQMNSHATSILGELAMQTARKCWDPQSSLSITALVSHAMALERQAELLGAPIGDDAVVAKLRACLQFDVNFRSALSMNTPKGDITTQLEGTIHVKPFDLTGGVETGGGELSFTQVVAIQPGHGCTVDWSHGPKSFTVESLQFKRAPSANSHARSPVRPGRPVPPPAAGDPQASPFDTGVETLVFTTHSPLEQIKITCPQLPQPIPFGSFWSNWFDLAHAHDKAPAFGNDSYYFKDWLKGTGAVKATIAQKTITHDTPVGSKSIHEVTEIDVVHSPAAKPGPGPAPPVTVVNPPTESDILNAHETVRHFVAYALSGDDRFLDDAYASVAGWIPKAQAFGAKFASDIAKDQADLLTAYQTVADKWGNACKSAGNFDTVAHLFKLWDWVQGKTLITQQPGFDLSQLTDKARACAQFRFKMSSHLLVRDKPAGTDTTDGTISVEDKLEPTIDFTGHRVLLTSVLPEQYLLTHYFQGKCTVEMHSVPASLAVDVELGITAQDRTFQADVLHVDLDPGNPSEQGSATCNGKTGPVATAIWAGNWGAMHMGELANVGAKRVYRTDLWIHQRSAASFATKDYQRTLKDTLTEDTSLKLIHSP
jgi:hypothetical protein